MDAIDLSEAMPSFRTIKVPMKRRSISMQLKKEIILGHLAGRSLNDLRKHYELPRSTVLCILKRSEEILSAEEHGSFRKKRIIKAKYGDLEKEVFEYYKGCKEKELQIGGDDLRSKAKEIAERMGDTDFKASLGWLGGFKKRFNIAFRAKSEDPEGSSDQTDPPTDLFSELLNSQFKNEDIPLSLNDLLEARQTDDSSLLGVIPQSSESMTLSADGSPPSAADTLKAICTVIRYVQSTKNEELIKLTDVFTEKLNHHLLLGLISESERDTK